MVPRRSATTNATGLSRKGVLVSSPQEVIKHWYKPRTLQQAAKAAEQRSANVLHFFKDHKKTIGRAILTTAALAGSVAGAAELSAGAFGGIEGLGGLAARLAGKSSTNVLSPQTRVALRTAYTAAGKIGQGARTLRTGLLRTFGQRAPKVTSRFAESFWNKRGLGPGAKRIGQTMSGVNLHAMS